MKHYQYFQNKKCEYFPCHKDIPKKDFSCLFCYCPLYALGDRCGGNFRYNEKGIKDCTYCTIPHRKENYDSIVDKTKLLIDLARKKEKTDTADE
ncbi:MAG: cysteine-rich small domain-containing protein [Anaerofustis sp.]